MFDSIGAVESNGVDKQKTWLSKSPSKYGPNIPASTEHKQSCQQKPNKTQHSVTSLLHEIGYKYEAEQQFES